MKCEHQQLIPVSLVASEGSWMLKRQQPWLVLLPDTVPRASPSTGSPEAAASGSSLVGGVHCCCPLTSTATTTRPTPCFGRGGLDRRGRGTEEVLVHRSRFHIHEAHGTREQLGGRHPLQSTYLPPLALLFLPILGKEEGDRAEEKMGRGGEC